MILSKQDLYQRINYMTEDIMGAVYSQCKSALSFTNPNARKSNTEILHDVINDCTIARFENFHAMPEFNRRMLTTHDSDPCISRPVTSVLLIPGQCPPLSGSWHLGDIKIPGNLHEMLFKVYALYEPTLLHYSDVVLSVLDTAGACVNVGHTFNKYKYK